MVLVGVFKMLAFPYTPAKNVISEKAVEELVIGNRRKTMTVKTCPSVYVCGDAVFGDASEGSRKSYPSPSWY